MKIKKILIIIGICLASIGLLSCSVLLFDNNNLSSGSSSSDEEIYTITYSNNEGSSFSSKTTKFKNFNKVTLPFADKSGYLFKGWYEGDTKVESITENRNYRYFHLQL